MVEIADQRGLELMLKQFVGQPSKDVCAIPSLRRVENRISKLATLPPFVTIGSDDIMWPKELEDQWQIPSIDFGLKQ